MAKRSSLFGSRSAPAAKPAEPAPAPELAARPEGRRYPVAKTREGKRVATVYLEPEALDQLKMLAIKERTTVQALLVEGVNAVFEVRGMSRIA